MMRHNIFTCTIAHAVCTLIGIALFLTVNISLRGGFMKELGGEFFLVVLPSICFEAMLHILYIKKRMEKRGPETFTAWLRRQGL